MIWLGRKQVGDELPVAVLLSGKPTQAPIADFWRDGTTKLHTIRLAPLDTGHATNWFGALVFLGVPFTTGLWTVTVRATIGTNPWQALLGYEIVDGGSVDGPAISAHVTNMPHGQAVLMQMRSGRLLVRRNPRIVQ